MITENKVKDQNTHLKNIETLYRIGIAQTKSDPELSLYHSLYSDNLIKIKQVRNVSEDILHKKKRPVNQSY